MLLAEGSPTSRDDRIRRSTAGGDPLPPVPTVAERIRRLVGAEVVRRTVVPVKSDLANHKQLLGMTLDEVNKYAQRQADWHIEKSLDTLTTKEVRALLRFAQVPALLSACGRMTVNTLRNTTGIISVDAPGPAVPALTTYGEAVSGATETARIRTPTTDPDKAIEYGKALRKLLDAPAVGGTLAALDDGRPRPRIARQQGLRR